MSKPQRRSVRSVRVGPSSDMNLLIPLTQQESSWTMMTSAPHTAVSIFEEVTPNSIDLTKIYDKVSASVKLNPWVTARLIMTPEGVKAYYGKQFVDCFEGVHRKTRIDTIKSYDDLLTLAAPYAVKMGEVCIDKDEPLFRVTGMICGETKRQLIVILSISSVIADVITMYSFFGMLGDQCPILAITCERNEQYAEKVQRVLGNAQMHWLKSSAMYIGQWLMPKFAGRSTASAYLVNEKWLNEEKEKCKGDNEQWVSRNDVLSSWFMKVCRCDFGFMNMDFRPLLELESTRGGSYLHPIMYRPESYATPLSLREVIPILSNKQTFRPPVPDFKTTLKQNNCLVSNYAKAHQSIGFAGCKLTLHAPVIFKSGKKEFEQYSRWKSSGYYKQEMVIFQATETSLGLLIFQRGALKLSPYLKLGPLKEVLF